MTAPVSSGSFTCAHCGGTFIKGWTDEEALTAAARDFPDLKPQDAAVICEDCYRKLGLRPQ